MNDLAPIANSLPAKRISPVLSPDLKARLYGDASTDEIANALALREEARAALPVLLAAARQPAGEEGVREVIGARFAMFPQPERGEGEWQAWWADYYDALSDIPWGVLEEAMKAYIRQPDSEFMPKPGKLLEFCRDVITPDFRAHQRAKWAVESWDRRQADNARPPPVDIEPPRPKTIEDATAIRRMADETLAQLRATAAARKNPRGDMPSTAGKPDETGITPQMREVLARQRAQP